MDAPRLQRLSEVFESARQLPDDQREAFLQQACGDDADLLVQARSLLEHHERPGQSMDVPLLQRSPDVARLVERVAGERAETLPERIGHYRVIRKIGQGGMGTVFEAEQENPRRTVALKVIHAGIVSTSMLRRLELEAHILGLLQHPGIAQIFEAGTFDSGMPGVGPQPFLAMEYVEGVTVTDFVAQRTLSTRDRLALVASICDAVQHAHQKGVIHRDLKPGNILVDAKGQPKILDFGVARVTDSDVRMTTLHTDVGQLIGTLPYMSPEQASGDADGLDTRSDVYALGVLAYELLAGRLPYDLTRRVVQEAVRVIRDEEPTRLSQFNRTFRGDIETIIGKALEKDRARRYQAASDLADDIRRYLRDEAVVARPPSRLYQFQKFAKRNKALVTGAAAVVIALLAGVIGTSLALVRAVEAEHLALNRLAMIQAEKANVEKEKAKADAVSAFQQEMLQAVDPRIAADNRDVTVREALDAAAVKIDAGSLKEQPEIEGAVRYILGSTYYNLGLYDEARKHLEKGMDLQVRVYGAEHLDVAESKATLSELFREIGDIKSAEPFCREALATKQKLITGDHSLIADGLNNLGLIEKAKGNIDVSETLCRQALAMRRATLGDKHADIMQSLNNLAMVLKAKRGDPKEIDDLFQQGIDMGRELYGGDDLGIAHLLQNQAEMREVVGDIPGALASMQEAMDMRRRVFGDEHALVAQSMNNMGGMLKRKGDFAAAEPLYRQALEIRIRVLGPDHNTVAESWNNLSNLLFSMGKPAEAEPMMRRAIEIRRTLRPGDDGMTALYLSNLANTLMAVFKYEEAEAAVRESIAMRERLGDSGSTNYALALLNLAAILRERGPAQLPEVEQLQRKSLTLLQAAQPPSPQQNAYAMNNLGTTLRDRGMLDEAERMLSEALDLRRSILGADSPFTAITMHQLGAVYVDRQRYDDAAVLLNESLTIRRARLTPGSVDLAPTLMLLGLIHMKQNRPAEGEPLLREALDLRVQGMPAGHDRIAESQVTLGACLSAQQKFDEAEPLLLDGGRAILASPIVSQARKREASDWVIEMYESSGRADQATEWRSRREALGGGNVPASQP